MTRPPRLVLLGLLLLPAVFALDVLDVADQPLPVLYGIPVLLVAQRASPGATAALAGLALLLLVAGALLVGAAPEVVVLRPLFLAVMAALSVLLAHRVREAQLTRREAEAARAEAQEARRALEQFLGVIAHELRSPLTVVRGRAQLALRPSATPEQRERALGVIQQEAIRMGRLVQDLADAARIGVGRLDVRPQPTDLAALLWDVVEAHRTAAPERRIEVHADEPVEGAWDPDRLRQVIGNLVGNALKYSPDDAPVCVELARQDGQALMRVADRGPGLRPEDLGRLFRPFGRLHPGIPIPGTGLGLYVSRAIVEAHGGRIWAESSGPGQGTTFTITLPLAPQPPAES